MKEVKVDKRSRKSIFSKISTIALLISIVVFVSALFFFFTSKNKDGEVFFCGYKVYFIATGSMEPDYKVNSMVIVKQGGYDNVKKDDVIAFKTDALSGKKVFHRVIDIKDGAFVTKGDNSRTVDSKMVTPNNYIGLEVWHTNITAYYLVEFNKPYGWLKMLVLPVVAIVVFVFSLKFFINYVRNRKNVMA